MNLLEGVTVIDISRLLPGGFASSLLREQGARVIKVEQPGVGDYYRALTQEGALLGDQVKIINQGKESLGLDLKSDDGREILKKLIRKADVVLENFRPGVLKRLDLEYTQLKKINPRIILCSITSFGQKGEMSSLAGHDLSYLGMSGLLTRIRDQQGKLVLPDFQVVDLAAGYEASMKIAAALYQRSRTRKGCWIDVSMQGAGHTVGDLYSIGPETNVSQARMASGETLAYDAYETSDGGFVTLAALEPKFWSRFCELIGKLEWATSAELFSKSDDLSSIKEDRKKILQKIFKSKTKQEWVAMGRREDICLFEVGDVRELEKVLKKKVPRLGEQTSKILKSMGYSAEKIKTWKKEGVIA